MITSLCGPKGFSVNISTFVCNCDFQEQKMLFFLGFGHTVCVKIWLKPHLWPHGHIPGQNQTMISSCLCSVSRRKTGCSHTSEWHTHTHLIICKKQRTRKNIQPRESLKVTPKTQRDSFSLNIQVSVRSARVVQWEDPGKGFQRYRCDRCASQLQSIWTLHQQRRRHISALWLQHLTKVRPPEAEGRVHSQAFIFTSLMFDIWWQRLMNSSACKLI